MIPKNVSFNPQRNLKRFFQQLVVVVVYIIQFTVGILANIVVILVLALSPQAKRFRKNRLFLSFLRNIQLKKTSTSYHIMHLAVADSLLLLTLPFNADSRLNNGLWRFGSFGCKFGSSDFVYSHDS